MVKDNALLLLCYFKSLSKYPTRNDLFPKTIDNKNITLRSVSIS